MPTGISLRPASHLPIILHQTFTTGSLGRSALLPRLIFTPTYLRSLSKITPAFTNALWIAIRFAGAVLLDSFSKLRAVDRPIKDASARSACDQSNNPLAAFDSCGVIATDPPLILMKIMSWRLTAGLIEALSVQTSRPRVESKTVRSIPSASRTIAARDIQIKSLASIYRPSSRNPSKA